MTRRGALQFTQGIENEAFREFPFGIAVFAGFQSSMHMPSKYTHQPIIVPCIIYIASLLKDRTMDRGGLSTTFYSALQCHGLP
jgi:hypothetical protein